MACATEAPIEISAAEGSIDENIVHWETISRRAGVLQGLDQWRDRISRHQIGINAPRERVWQAIGYEFADVFKLSPGVLESTVTSQGRIGLGTTRNCKLSMMGAELDERITDWRENEHLGIDIYRWLIQTFIPTLLCKKLTSTTALLAVPVSASAVMPSCHECSTSAGLS